MKVYIFENSYYIGNALNDELKAKAKIQEVEVPDGKQIKVENYEVKLVDETDIPF